MTPAQELLAAGLKDSLLVRGVDVSISGVMLKAIVTPMDAENSAYDITDNEGEASELTLSRADLKAGGVSVNQGKTVVVYEDGEPIANLRVKRVNSNVTDPIRVVALCEVSEA